MFIIQRLGRDACWHSLPEEYYSLGRVATYRARELWEDDRERAFRVKDQNTGDVLVIFAPDDFDL